MVKFHIDLGDVLMVTVVLIAWFVPLLALVILGAIGAFALPALSFHKKALWVIALFITIMMLIGPGAVITLPGVK